MAIFLALRKVKDLIDKNRYKALEILAKLSNDSEIYTREFLSKELSLIPDSFNKSEIFSIVLGVRSLKKRYDYIVADHYKGDYRRIKVKVKNIIRIGCYLIEEHSKTPNHAAVSSCVEIAKYSMRGYDKLVNALLRKYILVYSHYEVKKKDKKTYNLLSHPQWIIDKWINRYGYKNTIDICRYNNSVPLIWFRINNIKEINKIKSYLADIGEDIKINELNKNYFTAVNPKDIIDSDIFTSGKVSVQNPVNGFVVNLIDKKNTKLIIDGCSAPGGKGSHIAKEFPDSIIYSIDSNANRIKSIQDTINRLNITNITTMELDMTKDALPMADTILLDVPCSGTGSIQRRPDAKWNKSLSLIKQLSIIQSRILDNAKKYLKEGGNIIYSTCSIEKEENFDVIDKFLNNNSNYILDNAANHVDYRIVNNNCIDVNPGFYNLDGAFAAKLTKIE